MTDHFLITHLSTLHTIEEQEDDDQETRVFLQPQWLGVDEDLPICRTARDDDIIQEVREEFGMVLEEEDDDADDDDDNIHPVPPSEQKFELPFQRCAAVLCLGALMCQFSTIWGCFQPNHWPKADPGQNWKLLWCYFQRIKDNNSLSFSKKTSFLAFQMPILAFETLFIALETLFLAFVRASLALLGDDGYKNQNLLHRCDSYIRIPLYYKQSVWRWVIGAGKVHTEFVLLGKHHESN